MSIAYCMPSRLYMSSANHVASQTPLSLSTESVCRQLQSYHRRLAAVTTSNIDSLTLLHNTAAVQTCTAHINTQQQACSSHS
jgi:hypothetical protein